MGAVKFEGVDILDSLGQIMERIRSTTKRILTWIKS